MKKHVIKTLRKALREEEVTTNTKANSITMSLSVEALKDAPQK